MALITSDCACTQGCVVTNTDEPPTLKTVRVVPRKWCFIQSGSENAHTTVKMWDDTGSAGRPGGLWKMGNMALLRAAAGQGAPDVTIFRPKYQAWHIDPDDDVMEKVDEDEYKGEVPQTDPGFELCSDLGKLWDDRGVGSDGEASAFRPRLGAKQVFFGDYFQSGRANNLSNVKVLIPPCLAIKVA